VEAGLEMPSAYYLVKADPGAQVPKRSNKAKPAEGAAAAAAVQVSPGGDSFSVLVLDIYDSQDPKELAWEEAMFPPDAAAAESKQARICAEKAVIDAALVGGHRREIAALGVTPLEEYLQESRPTPPRPTRKKAVSRTQLEWAYKTLLETREEGKVAVLLSHQPLVGVHGREGVPELMGLLNEFKETVQCCVSCSPGAGAFHVNRDGVDHIGLEAPNPPNPDPGWAMLTLTLILYLT
jgi:hypothetical protein